VDNARTAIWDRPRDDGRKGKRPKYLGQLLGKAKWGKPLADWITATSVGLLAPEMRDREAERVQRNDGWRRDPFISYTYTYIIVFIVITKGLAVETERAGMGRFKIGYIWLGFFCVLCFVPVFCYYFQIVFVIAKLVRPHPLNGCNLPLRGEDRLNCASALIFIFIFICIFIFAFCNLMHVVHLSS
jgi:hypothetical protein